MNYLSNMHDAAKAAWRVISASESPLMINSREHPLATFYKADATTYEAAKEVFRTHCPILFSDWNFNYNWARRGQKDDLELSKTAIVQVIEMQFDQIFENQRHAVYKTVYELARPHTHDLHWGEHHAFDDIPRLIHALDQNFILEGTCSKVVRIWKNEQHLTQKSCFYELEGRQTLWQRAIGYINGIGTSFDVAKGDAYRLSDNVCQRHQIEGIWSATHGTTEDILVSVKLKGGKLPEPVGLLLKRWYDFFDSNPHNNSKYLQICFSQGVLMTRNALHQLPDELQRRICIIAIAPACFIIPQHELQIRHFYKEADIVPTHFACNNIRLHQDDHPEIIEVPHDGSSHPHDPHGVAYVEAIRPFVDNYLASGSIL